MIGLNFSPIRFQEILLTNNFYHVHGNRLEKSIFLVLSSGWTTVSLLKIIVLSSWPGINFGRQNTTCGGRQADRATSQYPGLPVTELVCNNGITESFESSSAIMFPVRNEIKRAKDENVKQNPVRTLDLGGRQFDRDVCTRLSSYLQHLSLQVKRSSKIHQHLPSNIMHWICIFKGFETKKFTSKSLFLLLSTHLAGPQV